MKKVGIKKSGRNNVSIRDVAKAAGVSIASVSRVMNDSSDSVAVAMRNKVLKAVEELDYSPNWIGQALRAQSNDTYAMIVSSIQNNFYSAVAWEIESRLNDQSKVMLIFNSNESAEIQDRCFDEIRSRQVAGVFILCAVESPKLKELTRRVPTIFINRRIPSMPDVPFVGIDDQAAATELAGAILRDHEDPIGIIHGPIASDTSARRLNGYLAAFSQKGREIAPEDLREAQLSMESGYENAVQMLAQKRYSAIVCGTDLIAYGVYRRCRELGLSVPTDTAIYGFDDNPLNQWLAPWLNTVSVPHVKFADAAIARMEQLQSGEAVREKILPYDIVLRR